MIAVGISLIIVIYESVRPQLTILWRIPGTTIYRNMKQESRGNFIPNVLIMRIGSSMYFANASFVKDMLMAYVTDLEEVNRVEYLVLEMTPVITVDSTAIHVIHDIVENFRSRHVQVAFAMVGNRVEKTMRKANLKSQIGDQWFFPTVDEAVQYCLKHQHVKRQRQSRSDSQPDTTDATDDSQALPHDAQRASINLGNELGFSNELHHAWTAVFITLAVDVPMIMSEITAVLKRLHINIMQAQIEPQGEMGAKHTYYIVSQKNKKKLEDWEILRLREELGPVIAKASRGSVESSPSSKSLSPTSTNQAPRANGYAGDMSLRPNPSVTDERIKALEEALNREQSSNQLVQTQLVEQGKRMDQMLAMYQAALQRPAFQMPVPPAGETKSQL
eukprot:gnl/TRDRNA2_/TRDRNA2_175537_c2_seq1.p1 gnl/TRDRNA2_/TRDRNA2_175537_c2~~gnl/TRDRNA2_/TRDRNA2_175537_c2_seq1.p1  ORF type:complete len:451 (-),score=93.36 gnl/TRDRNA2_/TRDRNA2_175537_c2_seq1:184-1350(-)